MRLWSPSNGFDRQPSARRWSVVRIDNWQSEGAGIVLRCQVELVPLSSRRTISNASAGSSRLAVRGWQFALEQSLLAVSVDAASNEESERR